LEGERLGIQAVRAINCVRARDMHNGGSVVASDAVGVADAREQAVRDHNTVRQAIRRRRSRFLWARRRHLRVLLVLLLATPLSVADLRRDRWVADRMARGLATPVALLTTPTRSRKW
jgi:hypothetical protein